MLRPMQSLVLLAAYKGRCEKETIRALERFEAELTNALEANMLADQSCSINRDRIVIPYRPNSDLRWELKVLL